MNHPVLTRRISRQGDAYLATCPELELQATGRTPEEAQVNLREAIERFLESAPAEEVERKVNREDSPELE